jgi:hypothetical protein
MAEANERTNAQRDAAAAHKDAAEAIVRQQRVEIELAKQREQTAIAQRALLELQEKLKPRVLSAAQRDQLIRLLAQSPRGPVEVFQVEGDREAFEYAEQIANTLHSAGWDTVSRSTLLGTSLRGICIAVHDAKSAPPYAATLQHSFAAVGLELPGIEQEVLSEAAVRIIVGTKP